MDLKYNNKQLISVEYPGTVESVDNMCKTLGGDKMIQKVFSDPTKRLEVRFRPDDPYCKCAHGDRFNTTNVVIKVVKRTRKRKDGEPSTDTGVQFNVDILGVACNTYKFKTLADFQLLPITRNEKTNEYISFLSQLVPSPSQEVSWMNEEVDLFVPPVLFSRFDLPQSGYVDPVSKPKLSEKLPPNVIGRCRKRRAGFAVFATFEGTQSCSEPHPDALNQLKGNTLDIETKDEIAKLFETRPIMTKNAVASMLKCDRSRLKYALPCVAYYFTNGPWRAAWVKFGYDPRKDPAAKIHQVLDLRLSPNVGVSIRSKRTERYYVLPNKSSQASRAAQIIPSFLVPGSKEEAVVSDGKSDLLSWQFIDGEMPTARQIFYQLCDIHLDSVQQLVHKNDGRETVCLERDGWCEPGTIEKCREIMTLHTAKVSKEKESS